MYALVKDNIVISTTPNFFDVPAGFELIACPDNVVSGTPYENGQFVVQVPTLEEARKTKLAELTSVFDAFSRDACIMSSLGFEIDANETANRNIGGLVLVMDETDTTMFCDYNNEFHELTKAQLEIMRKEIVFNSQQLYQKKWQLREQINAATTIATIDAIDVYSLLNSDDDSI